MSYAEDVAGIWQELEGLPEKLREKATSKGVRLSQLKQLTGENAIQRSSQRLDAKTRATYRSLGLELEPEDDVPIYNFLGDDVNFQSGNDPGQTVIREDPPARPPATPPRMPAWAAALLGAALAGAIPAGVAIGYLMRPQKTVTAIDSNERTTIGLTVTDD